MLPTESVRRLSKNRSKVKKTTHVKTIIGLFKKDVDSE